MANWQVSNEVLFQVIDQASNAKLKLRHSLTEQNYGTTWVLPCPQRYFPSPSLSLQCLLSQFGQFEHK